MGRDRCYKPPRFLEGASSVAGTIPFTKEESGTGRKQAFPEVAIKAHSLIGNRLKLKAYNFAFRNLLKQEAPSYSAFAVAVVVAAFKSKNTLGKDPSFDQMVTAYQTHLREYRSDKSVREYLKAALALGIIGYNSTAGDERSKTFYLDEARQVAMDEAQRLLMPAVDAAGKVESALVRGGNCLMIGIGPKPAINPIK